MSAFAQSGYRPTLPPPMSGGFVPLPQGTLVSIRCQIPARSALRVERPIMAKQEKGNENNSGKMKRKVYEKKLHELQVELCHLQEWVKAKGLKVIIIFEGRDAAGKGGTIKALTERVSPRVFRVVALPAPTDRETTQM